jgi:hypothetical protein
MRPSLFRYGPLSLIGFGRNGIYMNRCSLAENSPSCVWAVVARACAAKGQCKSISVRDQARKSALRARGKCIAGYSPPRFAA